MHIKGVADSDCSAHGAVEAGHCRPLTTTLGTVDVQRLAYCRRGHPNLHPAYAYARSNLPTERHFHGLRRLAAVDASRGSSEDAAAALERATGQWAGKRQVESLLAQTVAEDFYETRVHTPGDEADAIVISADGKGTVMRPYSIRQATAKAAAATNKLTTRLFDGEKRNRGAWRGSKLSTA